MSACFKNCLKNSLPEIGIMTVVIAVAFLIATVASGGLVALTAGAVGAAIGYGAGTAVVCELIFCLRRCASAA